jgi:hypothetical protein
VSTDTFGTFGQTNGRPAPPDPDEFLFGGQSRKGRSMNFLTPNVWRVGTVIDKPTVEQAMDPETRQPKFWPGSNDPVYQLVVPVQVDLARFPDMRNPELGDDDGRRFFYLSGSRNPASMSSLAAANQAVAAAGDTGIRVGAEFGLCWVGNGQKSPNAPAVAQAPKQYQGHYKPPADNFLMGAPAGEQAATTPPPPPAAAPPVPPAAPAYPSVPSTPGPGEQGGPPPVPAAPSASTHYGPTPTPGPAVSTVPQPSFTPGGGYQQPAAPAAPAQPAVQDALSREDEIMGRFHGKATPEQIQAFINSGLSVDQIISMFGGPLGVSE